MFVDSPDLAEATNFNTANNHNHNKSSDHYHGLKHICPNDSLKTTLMAEKEKRYIMESNSPPALNSALVLIYILGWGRAL